jgi:hypothetical protein
LGRNGGGGLSEPATLEVVVALITQVREHQAENFKDLKSQISEQKETIDNQNEKLEKAIKDKCKNCSITSILTTKVFYQWIAITALGTWLSVVSYYYYLLAVEFYRYVGKS